MNRLEPPGAPRDLSDPAMIDESCSIPLLNEASLLRFGYNYLREAISRGLLLLAHPDGETVHLFPCPLLAERNRGGRSQLRAPARGESPVTSLAWARQDCDASSGRVDTLAVAWGTWVGVWSVVSEGAGDSLTHYSTLVKAVDLHDAPSRIGSSRSSIVSGLSFQPCLPTSESKLGLWSGEGFRLWNWGLERNISAPFPPPVPGQRVCGSWLGCGEKVLISSGGEVRVYDLDDDLKSESARTSLCADGTQHRTSRAAGPLRALIVAGSVIIATSDGKMNVTGTTCVNPVAIRLSASPQIAPETLTAAPTHVEADLVSVDSPGIIELKVNRAAQRNMLAILDPREQISGISGSGSAGGEDQIASDSRASIVALSCPGKGNRAALVEDSAPVGELEGSTAPLLTPDLLACDGSFVAVGSHACNSIFVFRISPRNANGGIVCQPTGERLCIPPGFRLKGLTMLSFRPGELFALIGQMEKPCTGTSIGARGTFSTRFLRIKLAQNESAGASDASKQEVAPIDVISPELQEIRALANAIAGMESRLLAHLGKVEDLLEVQTRQIQGLAALTESRSS